VRARQFAIVGGLLALSALGWIVTLTLAAIR